MCQFLLGTVQQHNEQRNGSSEYVSIPLRYGTTRRIKKMSNIQILGITNVQVSIPLRYGTTIQ